MITNPSLFARQEFTREEYVPTVEMLLPIPTRPPAPYWRDADVAGLHSAKTIAELSEIAVRVLLRMPKTDPISMVAGSIYSGGTVLENLQRIIKAITYLQRTGHNVFDHITPFTSAIKGIRDKWLQSEEGLFQPILFDKFHKRLYETRQVDILFLLPEWESSVGASEERRNCEKYHVSPIQIPEGWDL